MLNRLPWVILVGPSLFSETLLGASCLTRCRALGKSAIIIHAQKSARTNPTVFYRRRQAQKNPLRLLLFLFRNFCRIFVIPASPMRKVRRLNAARFTLLVQGYWLRRMQI